MLKEILILNTINKILKKEDYVQLFLEENSILNIYNKYSLSGCDNLKSIEGQKITNVDTVEEKFIILHISNMCKLIVGLKDDDYNGPEAIELVNKNIRIVI